MSETRRPVPRRPGPRDVLLFASPALWETWPFLPVIRHLEGGGYQCGLMYDCWSLCRTPGFGSTVFLANLFRLPPTEAEFFTLPKEVFDTPAEIAQAGWVVD